MMQDMEPANQALFAGRAARRAQPSYSARKTQDIADCLKRFFADVVPGAQIDDVRRMGGGASKEQFLFTMAEPGAAAQRYVLRMDPLEAITETSRKREYEVLTAVQGIIPAPNPRWLDEDGRVFGRPCAIMDFVGGVTKPAGAGLKVSGLGTWLGEPLRAKLKGPFLDYLVRLHGMDWRAANLPSFSAPERDAKQSARWSFNYWQTLWEQDAIEPVPIMSYTRQWLMDHMPDTADLCLIHCDYRTGNYLF
ncbi:MAG: phosphotransferase family protein, partial [Sphingopyxis sp.]